MKEGHLEAYTKAPPGSCVPIRAQFASYGNVIIIGGLYMSAMAKEHPEYYFASVSPGGTPTRIYDKLAQPMQCLMKSCGCVFLALRGIHTLDKGGKRYVDAVSDPAFPEKFPSGSTVASPSSCCPFYLGAAGPLTNQNKYASWFENETLHKEALGVVREAMER